VKDIYLPKTVWDSLHCVFPLQAPNSGTISHVSVPWIYRQK